MLTRLLRLLRNRHLTRKTTSPYQNYIESDINTKVAAGPTFRALPAVRAVLIINVVLWISFYTYFK